MEEIFRTIPDFDDYQVSNLGRVISNKNNKSRFLKPQKDAVGYMHVRLFPDDFRFGSYPDDRGKKPKLEKVHRLVALLFVDKPSEEDIWEVNHIDGDKENNIATNLEWVTRRGNIQHSWDIGIRDNSAELAAPKRYRPVKVTQPDGEVLYYQSRKHVSLDLPCTLSNVCYFIRQNKAPKHGRFKGWLFEDCPDLPPSETFKRILNIEQKLLEYEKERDYFTDYARKRRERLRNENK